VIVEILREYGHIMSDPAHLLAELSIMIIVEVIFLGIVWPFMRLRVTRIVERRIAAEHKVIDAEHGVTHPTSLVTTPVTTAATIPQQA
jgi:hypothetical protein